MPNYVVSKGHDAFAYYETIIEADTPEEARALARSVDYDGEWLATGDVQEFGDFESDEGSGVRLLEEGETIEAFKTIAVTAGERDALLAGLRPPQPSPAGATLAPARPGRPPHDGEHPGLDLTAIDALCERINV